MPTLFTISADLLALEELLTDLDGEITDDAYEGAGQAIEQWFDELGEARDTKIDNYCNLIAELTARSEARAAEATRISRLADVDANAANRLKNALKAFLDIHGLARLETPFHKLTVAKNGGQLPLIIPNEWRDDATSAPEAYHRTFVRLDTAAIRADLEAGQAVEGCVLGERGTHLRIK